MSSNSDAIRIKCPVSLAQSALNVPLIKRHGAVKTTSDYERQWLILFYAAPPLPQSATEITAEDAVV